MKKHPFHFLWLFVIFLNFYGCATPGVSSSEFRRNLASSKNWDEKTKQNFIEKNPTFGMTKEQIFWMCGSPEKWSKQTIGDVIFETWIYSIPQGGLSLRITTFDFQNGILAGFSGNGRYFSSDKTDDLRNYQK